MIYVTGDMHGEIERFKTRAVSRLKEGDTLIVLGDFGFLWQGNEEELKNIEYIASRKYNVLFLEGTHENFNLLSEYPQEEYCGGRVRNLGGNLKMLMRGEIYNIEDKKIFALGGGASDDIEFRQEGVSWWSQELPSAEEIDAAREKLMAEKKVDYILTHSAPQKICVSLFGRDYEGNRLSSFLDEVMLQVKYDKWYFGCYHLDRKLTRVQYAVYQKVIEITNPEKKGFFARIFKKKSKI